MARVGFVVGLRRVHAVIRSKSGAVPAVALAFALAGCRSGSGASDAVDPALLSTFEESVELVQFRRAATDGKPREEEVREALLEWIDVQRELWDTYSDFVKETVKQALAASGDAEVKANLADLRARVASPESDHLVANVINFPEQQAAPLLYSMDVFEGASQLMDEFRRTGETEVLTLASDLYAAATADLFVRSTAVDELSDLTIVEALNTDGDELERCYAAHMPRTSYELLERAEELARDHPELWKELEPQLVWVPFRLTELPIREAAIGSGDIVVRARDLGGQEFCEPKRIKLSDDTEVSLVGIPAVVEVDG